MDENIYLILPGCDDRNRGDQALIWETVDLAKKADYNGKYYMLAESNATLQSEKEGISNIPYVLKHPSRFSSKKNISYNFGLKLQWGLTAMGDFLFKGPLLYGWYRKIFLKFYSKETQRSVEMFSRAKYSFVKGGGFLHAKGGITETYKIYYFLYHIRLALSFKQKVFIMPNSFGPFEAPLVKLLVEKVLKKCEVVMTRETISNKVLLDMGISAEKLSDLAFYLQEDTEFNAKQELQEKGVDIKKKLVGITMRPYRFPREHNPEQKYEQYKLAMKGMIEWLSENSFLPVLIEHVYDDNEHEQDLICINEVIALLDETTNYVVYSNRNIDCRQLKKIYSKMDYLIGTRFHSVIFSLSSRIPVIAITYGGNKGKGIMKDMGLEEYALPMNSITKEVLIKKFVQLTENKERIKSIINEALKRYNEQKKFIINRIKE